MLDRNTVIGRRRARIADAITRALIDARTAGEIQFESIADFVIETPREESHGDFAANAAMLMAKSCRKAPREIATIISRYIDLDAAGAAEMEIAGPGFLNFRMKQGWLCECLEEIEKEGTAYGHTDIGQGKKIQVEFVSANPTGELHMGNARGAAIGDSLAAILAMAGYNVEREFYINDAGNQIVKFGETLEALYEQQLGLNTAIPDDGYHGADLPPLVAQLYQEHPEFRELDIAERKQRLAECALTAKIKAIHDALANFGVHYDIWFSEKSLHDGGAITSVIDKLKADNWLLEKEGALWLDCERFGEEKPEVLVRSNGLPTYYAADIAYHDNKFKRGFDTVIDIWGADHHGHVARMKGAMEAMGYQRDQLEVILMQFVRLYSNGELIKMSKRTGQYVTLNELVEEVGRDAARFFFVMRSADSLIDFDLDLAKSQTSDNPVYYVQYAHARICSILAAAGEDSQSREVNYHLLTAPGEQNLIRHLADYPDEIDIAATMREPHRIASYIQELAAAFHNFYGQCHCICDDAELRKARLALIRTTAQVIKSGLTLLGVSAPERM